LPRSWRQLKISFATIISRPSYREGEDKTKEHVGVLFGTEDGILALLQDRPPHGPVISVTYADWLHYDLWRDQKYYISLDLEDGIKLGDVNTAVYSAIWKCCK
jgi:hypothetical protein